MAAALLWLACAGCSMNKLMADSMAGALADQERSMNREGSVRHAREAAPGALKMLDGFIESSPENVDLLVAGAKQNASVSFAFIEEEDPAWARVLTRRALGYGRRALALEDEEMLAAIDAKGEEALTDALARLEADDDALRPLFWMAFAWGGLINVSRDDQRVLSDLPKVVRIMERIAVVAPAYEHAGAHLFLAVYYGSRGSMLGGDVKKSAAHFDAVAKITGGKYPISEVLRARYLCVARGEKEPEKARAEFTRRLEAVLALPDDLDPENVLPTVLAKSKARKLVKELDDYILPPLPEDEPPAPMSPQPAKPGDRKS